MGDEQDALARRILAEAERPGQEDLGDLGRSHQAVLVGRDGEIVLERRLDPR